MSRGFFLFGPACLERPVFRAFLRAKDKDTVKETGKFFLFSGQLPQGILKAASPCRLLYRSCFQVFSHGGRVSRERVLRRRRKQAEETVLRGIPPPGGLRTHGAGDGRSRTEMRLLKRAGAGVSVLRLILREGPLPNGNAAAEARGSGSLRLKADPERGAAPEREGGC